MSAWLCVVYAHAHGPDFIAPGRKKAAPGLKCKVSFAPKNSFRVSCLCKGRSKAEFIGRESEFGMKGRSLGIYAVLCENFASHLGLFL
jgi:hypothetical protein